MAYDFIPRLEILPLPQRRLWEEFVTIPKEFVLYGGTAVALHLGHRASVVFDFFGNQPLNPVKLLPAVPFLAEAIVTQRQPDTFSCTVDRGGAVKLSFFGLPEIPRLQPPAIAPDHGLQVASLLDLAGMKVSVVQMRAEAKDYLDIDAILADGRIDLPSALAAARAIYGRAFNPQNTLKALTYFEDGNLHRLPEQVKERLVRAACAVDLDRLPVIVATAQTVHSGSGVSP
ncbi:MAG: nucleotidyl transferase AbiEii/AbiGii toxin family protein [Magnetococcales bacterium]|nr:nucleotidyl transferase AbiEii/AbiGii toxin family protein [Magnetococcales bacterium]